MENMILYWTRAVKKLNYKNKFSHRQRKASGLTNKKLLIITAKCQFKKMMKVAITKREPLILEMSS